MSKRSLFVVLGVALIVAILWFLRRSGDVRSMNLTASIERRSLPSIPSASAPPTVAAAEQKQTAQKKRQEDVRLFVEWRNVPISYYGKVVDEDENPIGGVKVRYSVQSFYPLPVLPGAKSDFFDVVSDANGLFEITDHKGSSLGIDSLTKEGYKYSAKAGRGALYSGNGDADYRPDPANPEIFTMVHLGVAGPLVNYDAHFTVPCDGTPVRMDMMTGKMATDGDLQITLKREPYNIVFGGPRFFWSLKIEMIGGGLVELVGTGTYRAPQQGYEPDFEFEQSADAPKWGGGLIKAFYIKTRDDHYGRINIDLDVHYQPPPAKAGLEVYMNPTPGSRNLEYDPSQQPAL